MIKNRQSLALMVAALVVSIGLGTGAANAASWATSASPLHASYNGFAYGSGYGTYAKSGGSGRSLAYLRDNVSNGNGIYHRGDAANYITIKNKGCGSSTPCWAYAASWESTPRTQSATWVTREKYVTLHTSGLTSRLTVTVCEDAAGRPDICSGTGVASFNY